MTAEFNRREFLGMMVGAGIGLAAEREANTQENKEGHEEETLLDELRRLSFELTVDKTNLSKERKEIDSNVKKIISTLVEYKQALDNLGGKGDKFELELNTWAIISSIIPEVNKNYSPDVLRKFLFKKLPEYLSEYGIFCQVKVEDWVDPKTDKISSTDPKFGFFKINKILTDEFNSEEGKKIQRDIFHVEPLVIDGNVVGNPAVNQNGVAETYGQNIIIHDDVVLKQRQVSRDSLESDYDYFVHQMTDERVMGFVLGASGKMQDSVAIDAAYTRIVRSAYKQKKDFSNDYDDQTLTHETGHVIHFMESDYKKKNSPDHITTSKENQNWLMNMTARTETRGKIAALIFSKNKHLALMSIFEKILDNGQDSVGHKVANTRLQEVIISELIKNVDYYGLRFNKSSPISIRNQVVIQIADIAGDSKKIEYLGKELLKLAIANPDLNIVVPEVTVEQNVAKPTESDSLLKQESDTNPCGKNFGFGLGILGATVGGGALLLKRFLDRKNKIAELKSKEIKTQIPKRGEKKGKK